MLRKRVHPLVQVFAQVADRLGALGQSLLPPAVGHRPQQGDERGGRGNDHILFGTDFNQRGILLEGRIEKSFAGQKQHHKFDRVIELFEIRFLREQLNVIANVPGVGSESHLAMRFVLCFDGVQIRFERCLGIDDDRFPTGQTHLQVGTAQAALFGIDARLFEEVAVIDHAGQFHDPLELRISPQRPRTFGLRSAVTRLAGLFAELLVGFTERLNLGFELGVALGSIFVKRAKFFVNRLERFFHWLEQIVDRGLPLVQLAGGLPLLRLELLLSELEKRLVVVLQCPGREGLEGIAEFFLGIVDRGQFFFGLFLLIGQPGGEGTFSRLQFGDRLARSSKFRRLAVDSLLICSFCCASRALSRSRSTA